MPQEFYEITVKGHLDNRWANWFEGLTITREDNGETLLTGPVVDQAAGQRDRRDRRGDLNVIGGNDGNGILIDDAQAKGNTILGDNIGIGAGNSTARRRATDRAFE